ncbi:hypothetical protein [Fibrobacter sp.]|uniref:hypothetical protein n=1 Tax=Fibrobacter sp. TaxID=35828 RepID=UPI0025BBC45D|nr:hypothetical protein [Fibrobacter sp.]MBR3071957.1 hypothetical protein [Fibrobacter sp.]
MNSALLDAVYCSNKEISEFLPMNAMPLIYNNFRQKSIKSIVLAKNVHDFRQKSLKSGVLAKVLKDEKYSRIKCGG